MAIAKLGVIGGGTMGSGIAEVAARSGCDTIVVELDAAAAEAAQNRITASADKALAREKITEEQRDTLLGALTFTSTLDDLADRDLVVEAVVEIPEVKNDIFSKLDTICGPDAILASNTSSISITDIAAATSRPDKVLGMHFFNPATVQPLVELVSGQQTAASTINAVERFTIDTLGKHPIQTGDRAGFVVNRLLVPYLLSAITMLDAGQASKEDIDSGMKMGCAHPMGPLELTDLIGLDVIKDVADVLFEEFKEPLYAPPPLLRRMVTAGQLGRKSGQGFYNYEKG